MEPYLRTYAEVSLSAIGHNIEEAKKRISEDTKLLAVIKANAYGHGAVRVGKYLESEVDYFAVATLEEGEELRENGITLPILILGYTSPKQFEEAVRNDITVTVYHKEAAKAMNECAARLGMKAKVHVALDTGMTRIGFQITEEDADVIADICKLPDLYVEGVFTHFSCADQEDKAYCMRQLEGFEYMRRMLSSRGAEIPVWHICNSAGIMEFDKYRYDMVRSGIITYGIYPSEDVRKENLDLTPALEWKARVIHVKDVKPGVGVSYGATFVTKRETTRIATVSVGYADGYPRALSNKGRVLIRGSFAPILGRVCMDQMMVDVTDIPGVQVEDVVTLVGKDGGNRIPIEEIADPAGRFNYEMLCTITSRVPRIYPDK